MRFFLSAAVMVIVMNVFIILRIQLFVKIVPPLNLWEIMQNSRKMI